MSRLSAYFSFNFLPAANRTNGLQYSYRCLIHFSIDADKKLNYKKHFITKLAPLFKSQMLFVLYKFKKQFIGTCHFCFFSLYPVMYIDWITWDLRKHATFDIPCTRLRGCLTKFYNFRRRFLSVNVCACCLFVCLSLCLSIYVWHNFVRAAAKDLSQGIRWKHGTSRDPGANQFCYDFDGNSPHPNWNALIKRFSVEAWLPNLCLKCTK